MGTPEIVPRVFFALRPDVKQCAHYISDFQILYPAGSVLILHNYYEKRQRYINLHEKCVFLEYIAISFSRKLAAIIQNGEKGQIVVFDLGTLKRKRTLNLPPDSTTNRFETISFTHDDVYIVAVTGEPDWNLVLYNWSKGKLTSCTKAVNTNNPITRIQLYCSPTDSSEICLVGQGLFRLLSRTETVWRQYGFQKADQINVTTATWLTGTRILCGTSDGKLLLIDNGDLKAVYNALSVNLISLKERDDFSMVGSSSLLMFKTQSEVVEGDNDATVRSLISFPKGFAYSCKSGFVHFFEKEGSNKYKKRNVFRIVDTDLAHLAHNELNIVQHISINVSQDKLLAATRRAQLYTIRLWGPDINVAPEIPFKHLGEPLHHGPVNGLSMCVWKPLFATSGKLDRTIRLWNYETETVQFVKHFPEEIFCINLHPTGNFIAIGFCDRVDISIVLMNDIQPLRSLPVPNCKTCQFSFSGHYLAAVMDESIEVFGTVMMNSVFSLKGHIGKVNALQWIMDDKRLASCSSEGEIFIWDMTNGTLAYEIKTPGLSYCDIAFTSDGKNVYSVDSEGFLKIFNNAVLLMSLEFGTYSLEKILMSRSNLMMFLTGGLSGVLSVKMPVSNPPEFSLFQYHASRISQLKLSFDDQNLVTISNAGTVIIWKLSLAEGKTAHMDKNFMHSTEILINKQELEKKIHTIRDLSQKLYELEMGQAREMRDTESSFCEKIKEIHEKYNQNIEELKDKIEHAEADQNKQLEDIQREIDELLEKQGKEKADLIENYTNKLLVEYEKVRSLVTLKDETIKDFENRVAELEKSKEEETNELIRIYQQKLSEVDNLLQQTYEENTKNIREHETITQHLENDANRELVETRAKFEGLLKEELERNATLKDEASIMRKNFAESQKERNEFREKLEGLQALLQKYQSNIQALEKDVSGLKAEIVDRDKTAEEKDEKIFLLKKKIQEMDKFKFILDYKMEELKKEIDPKNREIREQKEQIADMEVELDNLRKINSSLELQLIELKEKIQGTEKEISCCERKTLSGIHTMRQIRVDIYSLYQDLEDFKKLKDGITTLYHKYHECDVSDKGEFGESDIQRALLTQREFLEKTIKSLRSALQKSQSGKGDHSKVVQDNVLLLQELNSVRKDLKQSTMMVENLEKLIGSKGKRSVVPSEAFSKMQQTLRRHYIIKHRYETVTENANQDALDSQKKVLKLQEKVQTLVDSENK